VSALKEAILIKRLLWARGDAAGALSGSPALYILHNLHIVGAQGRHPAAKT
jgi:hypothetical protein